MSKTFGPAEYLGALSAAIRSPVSSAPAVGCALVEIGTDQIGWTSGPVLIAPVGIGIAVVGSTLIISDGTAYQPLDGNLTELSEATLTAFGVELLAETDAASLRATQGLGAVALYNSSDLFFAIVTEATTARTLGLTDAAKYIRTTHGSAVTITVPPTADVVWAAATEIIIEQGGVGQVTVVPGAGVTINSSLTLKSHSQYSVLTLKRVALDTWTLGGERAES